MDKYYRRISLFLVKNHNISKEDSELYEYAIKITVQGILNIGSTILLGCLFGTLNECVCLFMTFFILRKLTGGLHARKYINCLISSTILIILSTFVIRFFENNLFSTLFKCTVIIFSIIICIFSPIDNPNKKLLDNEKNMYKILTIITLTILIACMEFSINHNWLVLGYSSGIAIILDSFLLIIAKLKKK